MRNFYIYPDELQGKELIDTIRREEPDVPIVSYSQLSSWNRCEYRWYLSYVEKWRQRDEPRYLTLGKLMHEALAIWYRSGGNKEAVKLKFMDQFNQYSYRDSAVQILDQCVWLMERYMDSYSLVEDAGLIVEAVEEHFIFALWTPAGRKFYLQGYVDLRGRDSTNSDVRWIRDHKTASKFWTPWEFDMDFQLPLYAAAYHQHGIPVFGVSINQVNSYNYKKREDVTSDKLFKREINFLTETQMQNVLMEVGLAVDEMLGSHSSLVRRRMGRDCNRCWFKEPCYSALQGFDLHESLSVGFYQEGKEDPRGLEELEVIFSHTEGGE